MQLLGVHAEEHAVNGLELQGVVMQVHQLHQGVAGGMGQSAPPGSRVGLSSSQQALAVAREWLPSPMA